MSAANGFLFSKLKILFEKTKKILYNIYRRVDEGLSPCPLGNSLNHRWLVTSPAASKNEKVTGSGEEYGNRGSASGELINVKPNKQNRKPMLKTLEYGKALGGLESPRFTARTENVRRFSRSIGLE